MINYFIIVNFNIKATCFLGIFAQDSKNIDCKLQLILRTAVI